MKFIFIIFLFVIVTHVIWSEEDLYKVLGVRKTASGAEIKSAYKKLARLWHPDKNQGDPTANEKFMKINEAYETLSDSDKRTQYDNFGTTSAQAGNQQQQHHGGNPFGGGFGSFQQFFQQGPFGWTFNFGGGDSATEKHRITYRAFQTKILPESKVRPSLIYVYSDFCYQCMQVDLIWDRVVQDLEAIGMGVGTFNIQLDRALANKLRVSNVPSFVGVVGGKLRYYSGDVSVQRLRDFIRTFFPDNLITKVNDNNYQGFLDGWRDNKVRALFFGVRPMPTLRYILAAYANRERVAAGYVYVASFSSETVMKRFHVSSGRETLLMFNEDTASPTASMTMKQLPRSTLDEMIESNKYLMLPRLSSQSMLREMCPEENQVTRKRLCVMLVIKSTVESDPFLNSFRQYAQEHADRSERVRYTYVFEDTQKQFVHELVTGFTDASNESSRLVAVIWRRNRKNIHFDWLEDGWPLDKRDLTRTSRKLTRLVDWHLENSQMLPFSIDFSGELIDENAENLLKRIILRLSDWYDAVVEKILSLDEVTVLTTAMAVGFIMVMAFMMRTLATLEEKSIPQSRRRRSQQRPQPEAKQPAPENIQWERPTVYVHQLQEDTFENLITKTDPGTRTVVVMVDQDSRERLLQHFAQVVLPYSRSDAFKFAFLNLEEGLPWFRHLLEETLNFERNLSNINQRNCIGTVLAINGIRKYYCMYHAYKEKLQKQVRKPNQHGDFLGLEDSSDSEDSDSGAEKLFQSDLLVGFGHWLDRLCEGSLPRYRVDYWPQMTS